MRALLQQKYSTTAHHQISRLPSGVGGPLLSSLQRLALHSGVPLLSSLSVSPRLATGSGQLIVMVRQKVERTWYARRTDGGEGGVVFGDRAAYVRNGFPTPKRVWCGICNDQARRGAYCMMTTYVYMRDLISRWAADAEQPTSNLQRLASNPRRGLDLIMASRNSRHKARCMATTKTNSTLRSVQTNVPGGSISMNRDPDQSTRMPTPNNSSSKTWHRRVAWPTPPTTPHLESPRSPLCRPPLVRL